MSERFKHLKRQSCYDAITRTATAQSDIKEGDKVVVYIDKDGEFHVREKSQFEDGRFKFEGPGVWHVQRQPVKGQDL